MLPNKQMYVKPLERSHAKHVTAAKEVFQNVVCITVFLVIMWIISMMIHSLSAFSLCDIMHICDSTPIFKESRQYSAPRITQTKVFEF